MDACQAFAETLVDLVVGAARRDLAAVAFRHHRRRCARCESELAAFLLLATALRNNGVAASVNHARASGVSAGRAAPAPGAPASEGM